MREEQKGLIHKIAQNADFAQSRQGENPAFAKPWYLKPCLRRLYPERLSFIGNSFERATPDTAPKVVLYNLVDETLADGESEAERLMAVLREYAERSHYQVVEELCDVGSAEDPLRPGLSGMLDLARKHTISGVLTISPSAISQNLYQLLAYREALEGYNVWLRFCDF